MDKAVLYIRTLLGIVYLGTLVMYLVHITLKSYESPIVGIRLFGHDPEISTGQFETFCRIFLLGRGTRHAQFRCTQYC